MTNPQLGRKKEGKTEKSDQQIRTWRIFRFNFNAKLITKEEKKPKRVGVHHYVATCIYSILSFKLLLQFRIIILVIHSAKLFGMILKFKLTFDSLFQRMKRISGDFLNASFSV